MPLCDHSITQERGITEMAQNGKLVVKGKNIEVTPALREYSEKRVAKLSKFFQDREDVQVDIVLSVERDTQIAEITYHLGGLLMRGESRTKDLYASIDGASDKIEAQVRKHKARIKRKYHSSLRFGDGLESPEPNGASEPSEDEVRIVRTKRFTVKPMDVEEAVLQMELLGHDFFVFANAGTEEVNVVYKRKDGRYGLMEPTVG